MKNDFFYCSIMKRGYNRPSYQSNSERFKGKQNGRYSKLFDPPQQIRMRISSIQVRKYCQRLYANKDYNGLSELNECFKNIRRAIMQIRRPVQTSINESIIRNIELIEITHDELSDPFYTLTTLPTENKIFNSEQWILIYKEMLPKMGYQIDFTHEVFTILLDIYINITLAEASIQRDKLQKEEDTLLLKAINRLKSDKNYSKEEEEKLRRKFKSKFFEEYEKLKDERVYKRVDDFRDYMKTHKVDDFSDPKIVSIWRIVTLNAFIIPSKSTIIQSLDNSLFSIYTIHKDPKDYVTAGFLIRSSFFSKHSDYSNEKSTPEIWEEWKELYIFLSIIIGCLQYRLSDKLPNDVSQFDSSFASTMVKSFEQNFVPWKYSSSAAYSQIDLESKEGKKRIQFILNRLTKDSLQFNIMVLQMYDEFDVINTAIDAAITNEKFVDVYIELIRSISTTPHIVEEGLIRCKNINSTSYWRVFSSMLISGFISGDIVSELVKAFDELTTIKMKSQFIVGVSDVNSFLPNEFQIIKSIVKQMGTDLLRNGALTGFEKYQLSDALDKI